jgi:hypothetical protein
MNYEGFVVYCFAQGINPDIIRACRAKVMEDDYVLDSGTERWPQATLGYAELGEIDTVEQAIKQIKQSIWSSVTDFDELGRNLERLRTRQLIKRPHKALTRRVLKAYYLLGGQAD